MLRRLRHGRGARGGVDLFFAEGPLLKQKSPARVDGSSRSSFAHLLATSQHCSGPLSRAPGGRCLLVPLPARRIGKSFEGLVGRELRPALTALRSLHLLGALGPACATAGGAKV